MKIALVSSFYPFVGGGARNIVEWLEEVLREAGHEVERIYLPHVESPALLHRQMAAYRWVDLESTADRIITFRPPAHLVRHPVKVVWFIHHLRTFYDLWDSTYRMFPSDLRHRGIRDSLHSIDTAALNEARSVFTNSRVVADRLQRFNGVRGEVLYPPLYQPDRFALRGFNDEIVAVSRLVRHKRQHLLIEAMRFTKSRVRLRLAGATDEPSYGVELRRQVDAAGLQDRVVIDDRWISEQEKVDLLASCLAHAYVPDNEDSYGYPTLEAAHSSKATVTVSDSGGVLEFVEDGINGLVAEPEPKSIAQAMDRLYQDRGAAAALGKAALDRVDELKITWEHVVRRLLA